MQKFNVTPIINNLELRAEFQQKLNQDLKQIEVKRKQDQKNIGIK